MSAGRSVVVRWVVGGVAIAAAAAGTVFACRAMESHLNGGKTGSELAFRVVVRDPPDWMPQSLAEKISRDLAPAKAGFADEHLVRRVHDLAARHPWVRRVRSVRRYVGDGSGPARLEVDAEFRFPVAGVSQDGWLSYVDREGVVLPPREVPRWVRTVADAETGETRSECYVDRTGAAPSAGARPILYIAVHGITAEGPNPGVQWSGEDLAAALRLVQLIRTKPYGRQVTVVRAVRESAGEIHLNIYAQVDGRPPTMVRFGRFPDPKGDWVVSPERKLAHLDALVKDHGGMLAGLGEIDIRGDRTTYRP